MNEIDVFLKSEEAALGDPETLQAQLTESEVLLSLCFTVVILNLTLLQLCLLGLAQLAKTKLS